LSKLKEDNSIALH